MSVAAECWLCWMCNAWHICNNIVLNPSHFFLDSGGLMWTLLEDALSLLCNERPVNCKKIIQRSKFSNTDNQDKKSSFIYWENTHHVLYCCVLKQCLIITIVYLSFDFFFCLCNQFVLTCSLVMIMSVR